jgi:hypothetical protein
MLKDFDLIRIFKVEDEVLANFVSAIHDLYMKNGNPYHNFYHGFNVLHTVYVLLSSTPAGSLYNPRDTMAILLAALVHDVDHTGRTNAFEVSSGSRIALVYHDNSVLEQHHAATAFLTMQNESCDVLAFAS